MREQALIWLMSAKLITVSPTLQESLKCEVIGQWNMNKLSARKLQNILIKVSGDGEENYVCSSVLWFIEQQAVLKKQFK